MVDSEFSERKYRQWRAAAVTFGFLSVGLLIWGLVMHNHAARLEDNTEIRSAFTRDANEVSAGNDAYDLRFIDSLIPHYETAIQLAREAEARAQHGDIKRLAQKIAKDGPRDIERLRNMREKID